MFYISPAFVCCGYEIIFHRTNRLLGRKTFFDLFRIACTLCCVVQFAHELELDTSEANSRELCYACVLLSALLI